MAVRRNQGERIFYVSMACAVAVSVFAGFARTYFLSAWMDAPAGVLPKTPLVHLHGALFTGWIVLLLAQTGLVAGGRTDLHRKLGMFGAAVAALMVVVGTLTAIHGLARGSGPPGIPPRQFLAIPFFDMVVFATLVAAGIRARRDPQTHKRLMLLATIGILTAAIARWPLPIMQSGPLAFFGITDLFVLPLLAFDLATRGRVHRATLFGGLVILISQPLRLAISGTGAWLWFADLAVSLVS